MLKGGLGGLMKQAQKMQEEVKKAQEELAKLEVSGESGGGLVSVLMTGKHEVRRVKIDDSLLKDDREMLEDLLVAAFNDAVNKIEKQSQERMSSMTNGLNLPPGFKFPF